MQTITMKEWCTNPFSIQVVSDKWQVIDLTAYDWVDFIMVEKETKTVAINSAWSFIWDKTDWYVWFTFTEAQSWTPWTYIAYFILKTGTTKVFGAPAENFKIVITEDYID